MLKRSLPLILLPALFFGSVTSASNFPMLDQVAQMVIANYQSSTCDQLWAQRAQRQVTQMSPEQQQAIQLLHDDPQMQAAFFAQVSTPIVTKMFQCNMIP